MKDKILLFIIGVLVGAIISTGAFYAYIKAESSSECETETRETPGGNPPEMPSGQNGMPGQPPSMPNNNTQTSSN